MTYSTFEKSAGKNSVVIGVTEVVLKSGRINQSLLVKNMKSGRYASIVKYPDGRYSQKVVYPYSV